MLQPHRTKRFDKSFARCVKRGYDVSAFEDVVMMLLNEIPLPPHNRDHKLKGKYAHYRECHIKPDWLLFYRYDYAQNRIVFEDTGTHSDLF